MSISIPNIDFIFYHIEKCGGTSLRHSLYNYFINIYNKKQVYDSTKSSNYRLQFDKKNIDAIKNDNNFDYDNIKIIMSHVRVYEFPYLLNTTPIKITIIRNPIDRIISHYYYFDKANYNCEMIDLPNNIFKKYCKAHGQHMCRVFDCIESNNVFNIKKLKINIKNFTYILILENIDEDIKHLNKLLNNYYNCNYNIIMPHTNKNEYIVKDSNLLKEKIKLCCTRDLTLYNMVTNYNLTHKN